MALGDVLQVRARTYRCQYDECVVEEQNGRPTWTSESANLTVSTAGVVRARIAGMFTLRVVIDGFTVRDSVRVLPPVKDLAWSPRPKTIYVGDTLRVAVLARDSSGRTVGRLGASEHIGGTGGSGEVLRYDDHGYTTLWVNHTGTIVLVGRVAHRTDTLRVEAIPRPRDRRANRGRGRAARL